MRLDTTHGQSRAQRRELTELGIPLRRSWGDGPVDGQMCVTHAESPSAEKERNTDITTQVFSAHLGTARTPPHVSTSHSLTH